jgi:hypothetical protein
MAEDQLQSLRQASKGLLYPSESDEPIDVFVWPSKEPDATAAVAARVPNDTKIEEVAIDDFFRELESSDDATRFKALHRVLIDALSGVRILRAGEVQVQVYLIGRMQDGQWAGLHTEAVET